MKRIQPMTEVEVDALADAIKAKVDGGEFRAIDLARASGFSEGYVSQLLNKSRQDRRRNAGPMLVLARAVGIVRLDEA